MAYSPITTTEITVGKPTKRSLWQKLKDNFDYLFGQTTPGGLLNGSFEYDSDGDGIPDNWTTGHGTSTRAAHQAFIQPTRNTARNRTTSRIPAGLEMAAGT